MIHDNLSSEKKSYLRKKCKIIRSSYLDTEYRAKSAAICDRLQLFLAGHDVSTVTAYWPDLVRREPDIRPLLEKCQKDKIPVFLPYVTDFEDGIMEMHAWHPEVSLSRNHWGIDEPAMSDQIKKRYGRTDLIIVPALAADLSGFRLGYGKGFYDRFLERRSCATVTTVFDDCLFSRLPSGPLDVPVDFIITETRYLSAVSPSRNLGNDKT